MERPLLLRRVWWVLVIRGVLGVLFGLLAFTHPGVTLAVLVAFFGAYALFDGIAAIIVAFRAPKEHVKVWPFVLEGIIGILAGILAFVYPLLTAVALETLVAAWALVTGIFELVAAFRLRHAIANEWLLGLTGVLSIIAGIVLFMYPVAGIASLVLIIGAYAFIFGILLIVLGIRIRSWGTHHSVPGTPNPAL
jgi:uncharacterized membrane protein HdeD (DUF308 family)